MPEKKTFMCQNLTEAKTKKDSYLKSSWIFVLNCATGSVGPLLYVQHTKVYGISVYYTDEDKKLHDVL